MDDPIQQMIDSSYKFWERSKRPTPLDRQANGYDWSVYDDGEVVIYTTPERIAANQGRVYLTRRELELLIEAIDDHSQQRRDALGED